MPPFLKTDTTNNFILKGGVNYGGKSDVTVFLWTSKQRQLFHF